MSRSDLPFSREFSHVRVHLSFGVGLTLALGDARRGTDVDAFQHEGRHSRGLNDLKVRGRIR